MFTVPCREVVLISEVNLHTKDQLVHFSCPLYRGRPCLFIGGRIYRIIFYLRSGMDFVHPKKGCQVVVAALREVEESCSHC